MSKLDPGLKRGIERLLALGCAEAQRRRSPEAKLDALLETTVAVCDLCHPNNPKDFYVSDVSVSFERLTRSSLPRFDRDIRQHLERLVGVRATLSTKGGVGIRIPRPAAGAAWPLKAFWAEALDKLSGSLGQTRGSTSESYAIPANVLQEFESSLRHAFDAVIDDDLGDAYTLRVHRAASCPVTTSDSVDYALGYLLPSRALYELQTRNENDRLDFWEIRKLEELFQPSNGERVRAQSHTNVTSRIAGLVCHPDKREPFTEIPQRLQPVRDLERRAWRGKDPHHIFMMPISNEDLRCDGLPTRTVAHWYKAIREGRPDIEGLWLRRQRASRIFSDTLLRRYYTAVARVLADGLVKARSTRDGKPDYPTINSILKATALAYSVSSQVELVESTQETIRLNQRIVTLLGLNLGAGLGHRSPEWLPLCKGAMDSSVLVWESRVREAEDVNVLIRLIRTLDAWVTRLTVQERIDSDLTVLSSGLSELSDTVNDIRDLIGVAHEADKAWRRLEQLTSLSDSAVPYPHEARESYVIDGWSFRKGHQVCGQRCDVCSQESDRRVAFLFDLPPSGATGNDALGCPVLNQARWADSVADLDEQKAYRFVRFVEKEAETTPLEWIKRSCTERKPSLASVVTLLFLKGADVGWSDCLKDYRLPLTGLARDWVRAIFAVAELSQGENEIVHTSAKVTLELGTTEKYLKFNLQGPTNQWYSWLPKKVLPKLKRSAGIPLRQLSSRVREYIEACGCRSADDAPGVRIEVSEDGRLLNAKWPDARLE